MIHLTLGDYGLEYLQDQGSTLYSKFAEKEWQMVQAYSWIYFVFE